MSNSNTVIGIDLGTTFSVVSVILNGEPVVIPSQEGGNTVPSVVAFKKNGDKLVGVAAKRGAVVDPLNTISSVKRLMGHTYSEVKDEKTSYKIKADKKGLAVVEVPSIGKDFTPEFISSQILAKLKQQAEDYLGHPVTECVITTPAYFTQNQRVSTQDSSIIAGLNCLRIINEPTAAALAYKKKEGRFLIVDVGGATTDSTIIESSDDLYQVISSGGEGKLGGDDFDQKIVEYIIKETKSKEGIDVGKDPGALQRIKDASEKAKVELSSQASTIVNLPFISAHADGNPIHLEIEITRANFENMIKPLLERIKKITKEVMTDAGDTKIDEVLLVGGSTRVPSVQALVKEITGMEPSKGVNVDECVSVGAAWLGNTLAGNSDIVLVDIVSAPIGLSINGGLFHALIEKNSTIPTSKSEIFTTATDNQTSVTLEISSGFRPLSKDNKNLGLFNLDNILPARRGVPQIRATFDVDASGVLKVTAKDEGTGKEQSISITGSSNLSKEEIERMITESEQYRTQDEEAKALIMLKNEVETLCTSMDSTLEMAKDKVDESLITPVTEALEKARESLTQSEHSVLQEAKEALLKASQPLSEELYKNVQPQNQTETPSDFAENFQTQSGQTEDKSKESDTSAS